MKKLLSLRQHLINTVPDLKANPDKLLVFAENGTANDRPRSPNRSFEYSYVATLVVTDFTGDVNILVIPILVWLSQHQPDRPVTENAVRFEAEILNNDSVDIELKVDLTESIKVTQNEAGNYLADSLPEIIQAPDFSETGSPIKDWQESPHD